MKGFKLTNKIYGVWYFTNKYRVAKFLEYKYPQCFYQMINFNYNKNKFVFNIRDWQIEEFDIDEIPQKYIDKSMEYIKEWYDKQPKELKDLVEKYA